jgi:hypothetical protein
VAAVKRFETDVPAGQHRVLGVHGCQYAMSSGAAAMELRRPLFLPQRHRGTEEKVLYHRGHGVYGEEIIKEGIVITSGARDLLFATTL